MILRFLTSLLLFSTSLGAAAQTLTEERLEAAESAMEQYAEALEDVLHRGRLIYLYDQAAWHSTDELRRVLPMEYWPETGGWIVESEGQELIVSYFGMRNDEPYLFARLQPHDDESFSTTLLRDNDNRAIPFPPSTRRLIDARNDAVSSLAAHPFARCADAAMNTVVLPPDDGRTVSVYFLTPQLENGVFPAGGHNRFDVGTDGAITSTRQFANTCLPLETSPNDDGATPILLGLTHLLDPHPTEIHVFLSLWTGLTLGVVTMDNAIIWRIEEEQIGVVGWADPATDE